MKAATSRFEFTVFALTVFGLLRVKLERINGRRNDGNLITRRTWWEGCTRPVAMLCALLGTTVYSQQPAVIPPGSNTIVVDAFDSVSQWSPAFADGVDVSVHPDSGLHGRGIRIDFDFHGRGGYAVVRRMVNLTMPPNYEFSFAIRGQAPVNTLEFKMVDASGENVWWSNTPNFLFPREWTTVTRKKRQISFAWGPIADKELRRVFAIEIAITAGSGGKGSVWLDDLALTRLDPPDARSPASW